MKQFLKRTIAGAACLAMALLFAGSASAKGDIFTQRQILADEDCICGVIFLGYVDGEKYLADDEEYRMQVLRNSGYTEKFEFLTEIPSDRIVGSSRWARTPRPRATRPPPVQPSHPPTMYRACSFQTAP